MACSVNESTKQQLKTNKINTKSSENIKGTKTPNKDASNVTKDQESLMDLKSSKAHKKSKFKRGLDEQETLKCQHSRNDEVPFKEEYVQKLQQTMLKEQPTSKDQQKSLKSRNAHKEQLMLKSQMMLKDQQLKSNQAVIGDATVTSHQEMTKHHKEQSDQRKKTSHHTQHGQHAKKEKRLSGVDEEVAKHHVIIKKQRKASNYKEPLMNRNHRSSDNQLLLKNIFQCPPNDTNDENVVNRTQKVIRDQKSSLDRQDFPHHSGNKDNGKNQKLHHYQMPLKDLNDKPLKDHDLEKEERRKLRHQRVSSNDPLMLMQEPSLKTHQHHSLHGQQKTRDEKSLQDHEKEKDHRKPRHQKASNEQLASKSQQMAEDFQKASHDQHIKKENKVLNEHELAINQRKIRHHRVSTSEQRAIKGDHQVVENPQTLHGKHTIEDDRMINDHEMAKNHRKLRHQNASNDQLMLLEQKCKKNHRIIKDQQTSLGELKTKDEKFLKKHEAAKDRRCHRLHKASNDQLKLVQEKTKKDHRIAKDQQTLHGQYITKDGRATNDHEVTEDNKRPRHHKASIDQLMAVQEKDLKDHRIAEDQQTLHDQHKTKDEKYLKEHEAGKDRRCHKHQKASSDQLMVVQEKAMKYHRIVEDQQTLHAKYMTKDDKAIIDHQVAEDQKRLKHQKASNDQLMVVQEKAMKYHRIVEDQQTLHAKYMTKDDKAIIDHQVAEEQKRLKHQKASNDQLMVVQQKTMNYHQMVGDQQQAKVDATVVKDQNDLGEQKSSQQQKVLNDQLILMQHTAIKYLQLLDDQGALYDHHMVQDERKSKEHEILNLQKALLDQLLFMQQRAFKYQRMIEEDQPTLHDQLKTKDESNLKDDYVAKALKRLKQQKALNEQFVLMQQKTLNTQQMLEDYRCRRYQHAAKDKKALMEHNMFNEQKQLIEQLILTQQKTLKDHQPTLHGQQHKTKDELPELKGHEVTKEQKRPRHKRASSHDLSMVMQQKTSKNHQMLENQATFHGQHMKKDEKTHIVTKNHKEIRLFKATIDQLELKQKLEDLKALPDPYKTMDKNMVKEQEQEKVVKPQKHHEKHEKAVEDQQTVHHSYQVNKQKSLKDQGQSKDQLSLNDEKSLKDLKTTFKDKKSLEDHKLLIDQMTPRKKKLSLIKIDTILEKLDKKDEHDGKARKLLSLKKHIERCSNPLTFPDDKTVEPKSKPPVASAATKKIISLGRDINQSMEAKNKFKILMELPSCDFRNYFRKWMESDVVARSLQAKLRSDLIENFNKTKLGKELYGITTNTYEPRMNAFGSSSLVMAINTLLAEFMFVQNCHFTLSVYCTEVPFRHTLPDFESRRNFRFRDDEIKDLLQTVTANTIPPPSCMMVQKELIQTYLQSNQSLLFALFKVLTNLGLSQTQPLYSTREKGVMCEAPPPKTTATAATMTDIPTTYNVLNPRGTADASELQKITTNSKHISEGLSHTLPRSAHIAEFKRLQCNKATNTKKPKCSLVNVGSQTTQTGLEHHLNKHLTDLTKRVKELALLCQVPIAGVQRENMNQFNFEHLCKRLDQHTANLNVASLTSDSNNLQQLNQIFTNIRLCAQSLEQVLIQRESIPPPPLEPPGPPGPLSLMKLMDDKPKQYTKPQIENVTHMKIVEFTNIPSSNKDATVQKRPAVTEASQQTELPTQVCTVATNTIPKQPKLMMNIATNTEPEPEFKTVGSQTPVQHQRKEKSYDDWVQEMINTSSGKLFLDRVESSIRKAMVKQNNRTRKLYDIKLKHHREILRIRYKHMSMRKPCEKSSRKRRGKTRHILKHFSRQFDDFTKSQEVLIGKFQTPETGIEALKSKETIPELIKELNMPEIPALVLPPAPSPSPQATAEANLLLNIQRKLKKESINLRNLALILCKHLPNEKVVFSPKWEQCTKNLEKAVADARKTINELKEESNQVEQDFHNYIKKSRAENMAKFKSAKRFRIERNSCQQKSAQDNESLPSSSPSQQQEQQLPQNDSNHPKTQIEELSIVKETQDNIPSKAKEQMGPSDESRLSSEKKTQKKHSKHRKVEKNVVHENAFTTAKRELFMSLSCMDINPEKTTPQDLNNLDLDSVDIVANIINENDVSLTRKRSIIDDMEPLHTNLIKCNNHLYPKPSMINGLMKCSDLVVDHSESSSDDESDINEKSHLKFTSYKSNKSNNININNNKECNAARRRHLYTSLSSSSSASSSSSCSSIEKMYESTYKKYNLLQIQNDDDKLKQQEPPVGSNELLTTKVKTTSAMGSGSSGKLQRSIAKMKLLFSTNDVPSFPGDGQGETEFMETFIVNSAHSLSESSSSTSTNSKNSVWSAGSKQL